MSSVVTSLHARGATTYTFGAPGRGRPHPPPL